MKKRESRTALRERQLEAARAINVPDQCDVVVVGGGAAGLAAAITAAEAGAEVVVLERALECGLPILATGNGRCNFANVQLDPRRFNCPVFVSDVCGSRWLDDVLAFFRTSGLRWSLEDDRLYPVSRQAASVRNVLLARARATEVVLACAREVVALQHDEAGICLSYREEGNETQHVIRARTVIVACGGAQDAADLCRGLCDSVPKQPVLCPLACEPSPFAQLDGRRVQAQVNLTKSDSFFPSWRERGEVLFRSYGLSGIVIFDASRVAEQGDLLELDLVPDVTASDLRQLVDPFAHGSFESGCLDGVLDPQIAALLEQLAGERYHIDWPEHTAPTSDSAALLSLVKALPLLVQGPTDTDHAQVMRGGLATGCFDPTTLAARAHPWLFACGEALDVDADCGGFNLAWAWKSGMVAGAAAAREARA